MAAHDAIALERVGSVVELVITDPEAVEPGFPGGAGLSTFVGGKVSALTVDVPRYEELLADPGADPVARATVTGFERGNLVLFLVIVQFVQVLLLAGTVFGFFLLFGALTMGVDVQESWTGLGREDIHTLPYLAQVSVPLGKVSLFLGAFSLLYLTVSTVTDEAYREQFFGLVTRELERAVGVRAVYLTLREQRRQGSA